MAAPPGLRPIGPATYELGAGYRPGMRVPVRIFAGEPLLAEMDEQVFVQAANVATLPGGQPTVHQAAHDHVLDRQRHQR